MKTDGPPPDDALLRSTMYEPNGTRPAGGPQGNEDTGPPLPHWGQALWTI